MTKTKVDTSTITDFRMSADLNIHPPLPKTKKVDSDLLKLTTTKDENVEMVNGEITVVSKEVTTLTATHDSGDYVYGFAQLVKTVEEVARIAKDAGSVLAGQITAFQNENERCFRILVVNNQVDVQEGKPAALWPDGSVSPL